MKKELIAQYRASLRMLINAIQQCPEELWDHAKADIPYWQLVYHSLHFTNLYISADEASFIPWQNHLEGIHQLGARENLEPYTKLDLKNYAEQIFDDVEFKVSQQDLKALSGFEWLPMNKFELHLYNLRHLQHHIGQLVERLRLVGFKGIAWVANGH